MALVAPWPSPVNGKKSNNMNRRLRVMHVVRALQTGGLEILVLELCKRMQTFGAINVSVCALLPGDGLEKRAEYRDVSCTVLNESQRRSTACVVFALGKMFHRERVDVVHIHNFLSHVRAVWAAKLTGVPVIISTKHGSDWPRMLGSRNLAGSFYRLADMLVAVSRDVHRGFLSAYRFPSERTRVIPNGINTDRFCPSGGDRERARRRVLGMTGRPLLGCVCRLSQEKDIPTLLRAFRTVLGLAPEAKLVIVGDGPDRVACRKLTEHLGISRSVDFLGNRQDVDTIYPLLDIYVQPSYTEGLSLTMLEACSCALPIVAARVGGNPEVIVDRRTGILVPPRAPATLAAAVVEQWQHFEVASAMGRAARQRAVERFSLDRMIRDYVALYNEVYDRKVRTRSGT